MVASHWDWKDGSELHFGDRQNDMCVGKQVASVLEFRLDLGLGQGQNTRLSIIVIGQPTNRLQPHSSSGKLLRIRPSLCSISHLVLSASKHREGLLTPVAWQNTSWSLQGTGSQARGKGAAALPRWVSSKGAWKSMDREPRRLESKGSQRVGQGWASEHEQ